VIHQALASPLQYKGGGKGGQGGGGLVTKSRRSFSDFTSHENKISFSRVLETPEKRNKV
jgi:hypothetical protein